MLLPHLSKALYELDPIEHFFLYVQDNSIYVHSVFLKNHAHSVLDGVYFEVLLSGSGIVYGIRLEYSEADKQK